jgi:hypothetical protein
MKVKIIKEVVNTQRRKEIYELGSNKEIIEPEIYIMKPSGYTLSIHGKFPLEKYLNVDKIPTDFEIMRVESSANSGVVFADPTMVIVRIFCPDQTSLLKSRQSFNKCFIDEFDKRGVKVKISEHRPGANDMVFIKDGKEKKFCGVVHDLQNRFLSFFVTFNFDSSKIEGLYKLDSDKFTGRGVVNHITDVVGGIGEIAPDIDEDVVDDIVKSIVLDLCWDIE